MERLVYVNGKLVPESQASVSVFDRGFLYGDGLFETMRAYNGKVFRIDKHLQRFFRSAGEISLSLSMNEMDLETAIYQTLQANKLTEAYVRLTISRGEGQGADVSGSMVSNVVIIVSSLPDYPRCWYEEGMRAVTVQTRRDENSLLSRIKSLNYLPGILAGIEVERKNADEGIMLNGRDKVAEGTVSNLFLVRGGSLFTPSLDSGILPGITRGVVLEISVNKGFEMFEEEITLTDFKEAEEAFLTNSLREVVPLTEIDGSLVGNGKPGEVTLSLAADYTKLADKETK